MLNSFIQVFAIIKCYLHYKYFVKTIVVQIKGYAYNNITIDISST